ncbi:hypothetical protein AVEN_145296-1 [Araneus ventricosus]|uniref:Uncharacterized protein n=1 Tax=Araneus ventricosus TaxID=182803 RepID=A0A4Y2QSJ0_ARAVE|nr:hypothetical protein AVEN_145296-1 [Araneus ventricosus]
MKPSKRQYKKRDPTPKIARWALLLEKFEYEVIHRSCQQMRHVNALSRNVVCMVIHSESEITRKITTVQEADECLHLLKILVEKGLRDNYLIIRGSYDSEIIPIRENFLYLQDGGRELIVVPETMEIHNSTIQEKETISEVKANISKVQEENRRQYNRRHTTAPIYKINDSVAIKRTQLGGGLKLKPKFLGPYKVVKIKSHDHYDVAKVGSHEGPAATSTAAEHIPDPGLMQLLPKMRDIPNFFFHHHILLL